MPEDTAKTTPPASKPQAMDVIAKPAAEEKVVEAKDNEAAQDKPSKQEEPGVTKPKKSMPIGAIIMALLIGGGLIAVTVFSQLQK